jgi:hypothetical protein
MTPSAGRRAVGLALCVVALAAYGCDDDSPADGTRATASATEEAEKYLASSDDAPPATAPPPPPLTGRGPGVGGRVDPGAIAGRRAADTVCKRGYRAVDGGRACESARPAKAPPPAETRFDQAAGQAILDGTYSLATQYADGVIAASAGDPITYQRLIYPQDCALVSGDTGRCLIYLWKQTYATGYGAGGVDRGVWREVFFATHVGQNTYSTRIIPYDFVDPYYWECSDTPRANTPRCT